MGRFEVSSREGATPGSPAPSLEGESFGGQTGGRLKRRTTNEHKQTRRQAGLLQRQAAPECFCNYVTLLSLRVLPRKPPRNRLSLPRLTTHQPINWCLFVSTRGSSVSFVDDSYRSFVENSFFFCLRRAGLRGLALSALCCRRLRGSTWSYSFPWAYAHGYLLPRLRRSMGRPGVRPGIINCQQVSPPPWWADHMRVKQSQIDHSFASLVSRRGSPQCLSGPSSSFVCLRGSLFFFCLFSFVSGKPRPCPAVQIIRE